MPVPADVRRLPAIERDILRLHQELRKPQTEIARILGVSQPTVNYRYKRAKARLAFLEKLPEVTGEEIREVLQRLGAREQDTEAMVLYIETNSQSEVARRMQTSQGAVRYWVLRALTDHLQKDMSDNDVHRRVRIACGMLVSKPGIFNEPQKPGHVPKYQQVHRRLASTPEYQGVVALGERIRIKTGTYGALEGEVTEINASTMSVKLDIESQDITLSWRR